jgi:hypothetical protein
MNNFDPEWNALDVQTRGRIRAILYPVMFKNDPDADDVARVIEMVVDRRALNTSPGEYCAAIRIVLAGRVQLNGDALSAVDRPDITTRQFLEMVLRQLERRP